MSLQAGDVLLYQSVDGGNIEMINGLITMSGGLDTAVYLSLFGGNQEDNGKFEGEKFSWWGNAGETIQYRSETQFLLKSISLTSGNLLLIEKAVSRDLNWMIKEKVASSVEIVASIPSVNKLLIKISIVADGVESVFEFIENWKANS